MIALVRAARLRPAESFSFLSGLATLALGILHVIFERGNAGAMTGARRPRGRDNGPPPREMTP